MTLPVATFPGVLLAVLDSTIRYHFSFLFLLVSYTFE
jgi:hypothetical protein